ncbi:MAG: holo-ACP synthase [Acidimicrobiales bacterium]
MIGVGVDVVEIERVRSVLERRPRLAARVFSASERELAAGRADPVPSLAARFAAKEAAMKALGVGLGGVDFADLEIVSAPGGAPRLRVSGRAAARAGLLGVSSWHVSLSHGRQVAAAVVVAD